MDPAIKRVVAVLAAALIVGLGVIALGNGARQKAAVTTGKEEVRTTENLNIDAKQTEDQTEAEPEAQIDQEAHGEELYEGALAGLSEEEIAKMAMAEEESAARTEMTGTEDAVD